MHIIDKTSTEKWYWGYAFQGAVVLGAAPILLPLIVAQAGGAGRAGLVVAAFYLGELLAPLWGGLTEKTRQYKLIYLSGFIMLALGMGLFTFAPSLIWWIILAFIQGSGAAASNTVAGMYIVEYKPKEEWDRRIGWLQTFYGTGQTLGLGLAALLQAKADWGMLFCGILMLPALWIGAKGLPPNKGGQKPDRVHFDHRKHKPARHGLSLLHHYHRPTLSAVKHLFREGRSRFGLFILCWFVVMFGTWMIYNLYPLIMNHVYHINAGLSSLYYAVGAGVGIGFYAWSGVLGQKIGDAWILTIGNIMTVVSIGGLALWAYLDTGHNALLVPLTFLLQPIAWSPLIVAATALTGGLATIPEGEAMGIFNATTALASVLSALAAGFLADHFGYALVVLLAAIICAGGLAIGLPILQFKD